MSEEDGARRAMNSSLVELRRALTDIDEAERPALAQWMREEIQRLERDAKVKFADEVLRIARGQHRSRISLHTRVCTAIDRYHREVSGGG